MGGIEVDEIDLAATDHSSPRFNASASVAANSREIAVHAARIAGSAAIRAIASAKARAFWCAANSLSEVDVVDQASLGGPLEEPEQGGAFLRS